MAEVTEIREVVAEESDAPTLADVFGKDAAEIETLLAGESSEPAEEQPEEVVAEGEVEEEEEAGPERQEETVAEQEDEAEEEEVEEEEAEEAETVALTLASRDEDAEPDVLDLEAADEETRDTLALVQRRLDEGETLRDQSEAIRAQAFDNEERAAKVQYIEDRLKVDPSGFLLETVADEVQKEVLLDMMLDDDLFEFVTEKIEQWADGSSHRKIDAAERKAERTTRTVEAERAFQVEKQNRADAQAIVVAVQELVPDDYPLEDANEFYNESLVVLKSHIEKNGRIAPEDVAEVLERKLKRYGITPAQANGKKAARGPSGRAKSAEETGKQLVARRAKKKAAASAPVGAGTAGAVAGPPKGMSLEDAFKWADGNLKSG